ncbi:hypothetical protein [Rhodoplanes azumiensis]|uniref:Uncharacterized protein n=1 Tax=Rhodoplanes azumiensis TaxID=1897628 RepID=A0ABW5AQV9_9BRAD
MQTIVGDLPRLGKLARRSGFVLPKRSPPRHPGGQCMAKSILSAAAIVLMLGGASALAASPAAAPQDDAASGARSTEAPITLAQRGDFDSRAMRDGRPDGRPDGRRFDGRRGDRDDWRRGRAWDGPRPGYRGPPPGWRRYDGRPSGWRNRGCIQIGPVWYCP